MTIRSSRNIALGICFLMLAGVLLVSIWLPNVGLVGIVLGVTISAGMIWRGINLLLQSRIDFTTTEVTIRARRGRKSVIPRSDIRAVEIGTRHLMYNRSFPRIQLRSGMHVNLYYFEQPTSKAEVAGSLVRRVAREVASPTERVT